MQQRRAAPRLSPPPARDELDPWFAGPSTSAAGAWASGGDADGAGPSVAPPSSSPELVRRRVRARPAASAAVPASPASPSLTSSPLSGPSVSASASRNATRPASPQPTHKARQSSLSGLSGLLLSGLSSALDSVGAAAAASSSPSSSSSPPSRPSRNGGTPHHPLARAGADSDTETERAAEATRPRLREARERVGRLVDSASEGSRTSADLPRGAADNAAEVEVVVHQIQQGQSAAGIALLYGIDLATLRKVNKLWPSDPIHLRTHLYVPLEACRFHGDTLVRGPGEGQVSVVPKSMSAKALGKRAARMSSGVANGAPAVGAGSDEAGPGASEPPTNGGWADGRLLAASPEPTDAALPEDGGADRPSDDADADGVRVLDIVRLPASQLRFFPSAARRLPSSRSSLESDLLRLRRSTEMTGTSPTALGRKTSHNGGARATRAVSGSHAGPVISNDLSTLPPPLQRQRSPPAKAVVRLRPPTAPAVVAGNDIASRLSRWLDVAPPPVAPFPVERPRPRPRPAAPSREGSETARSKERERQRAADVLLEMNERDEASGRAD